VLFNRKGHTHQEMEECNYGMPSPAGYRMATRLMKLAQKFMIPVVTLIDTPGAYPSFVSEQEGQAEAIASSLQMMSQLPVPIVTIIVGEGGSGGALGLAMADSIAMMSNAYYSTISPEGAVSILVQYKSEKEKEVNFEKDCGEVAKMQQIFATDLINQNVIDFIIPEVEGEDFRNCEKTMTNIKNFLLVSLFDLILFNSNELLSKRLKKFRLMGIYGKYSGSTGMRRICGNTPVSVMYDRNKTPGTVNSQRPEVNNLLQYISEITVNSDHSRRKIPIPNDCFVIKKTKTRNHHQKEKKRQTHSRLLRTRRANQMGQKTNQNPHHRHDRHARSDSGPALCR